MKLENNLNTDTQWEIYETEFVAEQFVTTGSNYMVGNGYLGYRGTFADDTADAYVACVVTDTYDNADGVWKELVTAPNGLYTAIAVDGVPIRWATGGDDGRSEYRRSLDFRYGEWSVHGVWPNAGIAVDEMRLASAADHHLLTARTRIRALSACTVTITNGIDPAVWSLNGDHFVSRDIARDGEVLDITSVTGEHGYDVVVRSLARLHRDDGSSIDADYELDPDRGAYRRFEVALEADETLTLEVYTAVYSTNDLRTAPNPHTRVIVPAEPAAVGTIDPARSAADARRAMPTPEDPERPTTAEVRAAASKTIHRAAATGWDGVRDEHRRIWDERWADMDVTIDGDAVAQTVLRYNIYHNVIATPTHTDHLPIGARGLSCQAYQGAAFWDQEIFNLPMFMYTAPEIARNILVYRYRTLDGARRKARDLGYRGAFYAWISGDSGEEICPAYFFRDMVSGRPIRNHFNDWQIHISPDIAFTIRRYISITHDYEYLTEYGAEIVFEVARFIASRVHYRMDRDRYDVIRVLGPDEYHENVDNNFFTNFQARFAVNYAVEVYEWMSGNAAQRLEEIRNRITVTDEEVETWREVGTRLYVPEPDSETRLIEQFAGFFQHEDTTPEVIRQRLIEKGEYWGWPNGIAFATQVSKQADVTQLFVLHPTAYDREVMKANWEYYEPRTQHGSSLSPAVYAIVAAWVGHIDEAKRYFMKSCTVDLYNDNKAVSGGTFIGGIHTAACGISWQMIVSGFAGMYLTETGFGFHPHLPEGWDRLSFVLKRWGASIRVTIDAADAPRVTVYGAEENSRDLEVEVEGARNVIRPGETVEFPR